MARKRRKQKKMADSGKDSTVQDTGPLKKTLLENKEWVIPLSLGLFLFVIYLLTLLPGVDAGDSAELQFMSPVLGVAHPPGYSIELCFGKIFSLLPIGPDIAWRINFMMAVSGVVGALALYGTIRRITGSFLAGIVAALTLGFSSIYWSFSLVAEVYVFYSMFLLVGIYCISRFIETNKAFWLYAAMFSAGICFADRISEVLILPGFLILWFSVRKTVKLGVVRFLLAIVFLVLPFVFTVGYNMIRHHPVKRFERIHNRDSALRFQILRDKFEIKPAPSFIERARRSARYCLGLTYKKDAKFDPEVMKKDVNKYAWMLSGFGAKGDRYPANDSRNRDQLKGTSIGLLGLALCFLALFFQRKKWGWVAFGAWIFLANLVFILWHHRWDNLTFTVPGLVGLGLLVGLGAAGGDFKPDKKLLYRIICLVVPLFLLVTNYSHLNRNTKEEKQLQQRWRKLAQASFPEDVIISSYWPAMTYRYLIHIEAGREDVRILHENASNWQKLINYFMQKGQPVYLPQSAVNQQMRNQCRKFTEPDVWEVGFVKLPPAAKR